MHKGRKPDDEPGLLPFVIRGGGISLSKSHPLLLGPVAQGLIPCLKIQPPLHEGILEDQNEEDVVG